MNYDTTILRCWKESNFSFKKLTEVLFKQKVSCLELGSVQATEVGTHKTFEMVLHGVCHGTKKEREVGQFDLRILVLK